MIKDKLQSFRHPEPRLQSSWNYVLFGLWIFPLTPFLGAVGIVLVSLGIWLRQYRTIIRRPQNLGFVFLSLLLIITAGFAYDKPTAFLGLFNLLPFFIIFAAFSTLIQTTVQLRQLSWILVTTSLPVVIIGLGQLFLGWNFKLKVLWIVIDWTLEPGGDPPGRMASIFMHANTLAGYLMLVFILALGLWLESYQQLRAYWKRGGERGRGREGEEISHTPQRHGFQLREPIKVLLNGSRRSDFSTTLIGSSPRTFLFLSVVVIANFAALILTDSRNAWVIAIFACLTYAIYQGWHILVAFVGGVATSVILAAFAPSPISLLFRKFVPAFFWARLNDQLYPDRPVALLRKTQWEFAWSLTQQRPWTGWGLRNFTQLYNAQMHVPLGHPHNFFLMLSCETGLPTTLVFLGTIGWIFIGGVQILQSRTTKLAPSGSQFIHQEDRLIFFSYLVTFGGLVLFNTVDVSLFDFRLNTISWVLLSAVSGVVYSYKQRHRHQKVSI
ncbi:MAG: O-antigen ligase family protein [Rhizonema sp. PD37]|nr:O-antigen ligase family protein [Rhizonema sp. PD37]